MDYHIVSQGKTTIPSVADDEEMLVTDVRRGLNAFIIMLPVLLFPNRQKACPVISDHILRYH